MNVYMCATFKYGIYIVGATILNPNHLVHSGKQRPTSETNQKTQTKRLQPQYSTEVPKLTSPKVSLHGFLLTVSQVHFCS